LLYFFEKCYICYIVSIIEKTSIIQYESTKTYIIYIYNFIQNQINFDQNFIKISVYNLYALAQ